MPPFATAVRRRRLSLIGVCASLLLLATSAGHAQVWNEIGDAGDLPGTAQTTFGSGPLTTITGTLSSPTDVDLYCIEVSEMPRVVNLPVLNLVCLANQGPNIWLFDPTGLGVATNSTCAFGYKTLTTTTVGPLATYYIAVSYSAVDPFSGLGAMWQPALGGERTPDGPGAAGTLTGWAGSPVIGTPNPYQIDLSFTAFCDGATPATRPTWGSLKVRYSN